MATVAFLSAGAINCYADDSPKLYVCNYWQDGRYGQKDGSVTPDELVGKDKTKFNLNDEKVHVFYSNGNFTGDVKYIALNEKGKVIYQNNFRSDFPQHYRSFNGGKGVIPKMNILSAIKKAGPGTYTIKAEMKGRKPLRKTIRFE